MFLKLLVAALLPACALAQVNLKPYNVTAGLMFSISDRNGDGILDLAEIDANFRSYDANNDGRISRLEYTEYVDKNSPQLHAFSHGLYDIYDVDDDDMLDLHDFENFHKLLDGDGDGFVVRAEYVRYFTIVFEELEYLHGGGRRRDSNKL